jgi:transcriptional antiterminator RfaH
VDKWYVIRAKPRQEGIACENLKRQSFYCFYPQIRRRKRRQGKIIHLLEAYFPSYLFIRLDMTLDNISSIRSTIGVVQLVKIGETAVSVPNPVMQQLFLRFDHEAVFDNTKTTLSKGQRVNIDHGILSCTEALFESIKGEERAYVLMNILGRQTRVSMPMASLSVAPSVLD